MTHPDLYVLRHGQTEWNLVGRVQGRKNSPLTAKGQQHALMQKTLLDELENRPSKVFCSPQGRAVDTARLAIGSLDNVILDDRIKEIGFGDWEGLTRDEIIAQTDYPFNDKTWKFRSPGGENFDTIYARIDSFLQDVTEPAIIITRGVTATVMRGICMGMGQLKLLQLSSEQGCIFQVSSGVETILRV